MRNFPVFSGLVLCVFAQLNFFEFQPIFKAREKSKLERTTIQYDLANFITSDTLFFCVENGNAELPANNQTFLGESDSNATSCSAHIWSAQQVTDQCGVVTYNVRIFLFNETDFVQIIDPTEILLDSNQQATLTFDTRSGSLPSDHVISLNGIPYTGNTCGGSGAPHRLLWTVVNDCNETTTFEYLILVEDCHKPFPICVGLSSIVMPSSGQVTVYAEDFNAQSIDDCTPPDSLLYSFNGNDYQPSREFSCNDIDACLGGPSHLIEIWVADQGRDMNCNGMIEWNERNKDFCTTFIVIDDNDHACVIEYFPVSGRIQTENLMTVSFVNVFLRENNQTIDQTLTLNSGFYYFSPCLIGQDLEITCEKNDDHKNGVSTIDLIKIQKHLLGIQLLDSPYKLIAADVNNSRSVSVLDLIDIKKLILGLTTEFPHSQSWKFVPESHEFQNPLYPWPFPESIHYSQGLLNGDFIGIKIGDVNGNVIAHLSEVLPRNARDVLEFNVEDLDIRKGQTVEIPVLSETDLLGFQFTLRTVSLQYIGVKAGAIDVTSDCIAVHNQAITMSYAKLGTRLANLEASPRPSSVDAEPLFTLTFIATADGSLSEMLKITSNITEAEAYRDLGARPIRYGRAFAEPTSVEVLDIQLSFGTPSEREESTINWQKKSKEYALYQNEPNPFLDQTVIGFDLPDAMPATLSVCDMHGRVIQKIEGNYVKGFNEIVLITKDLGITGVYSYQLNAGKFTQTRRLIISKE